jgi:AcrR family transcriptional regulator
MSFRSMLKMGPQDPKVTDNDSNRNTSNFLFIAHPGHELCVHAWLTRTRPKVFVLTDGSGHDTQSRIASTTRVLDDAGASRGSIYARFTDAELYALILKRDFQPLLRVVDEFAEAMIAEKAAAVAGDAIEGFNPTHDICRMIINAAVEIARRRDGREIVNQDFLLVGRHAPLDLAGATTLQLDEAALQRKLDAAHNFLELRPEVDAVLGGELLAFHQYPQIRNETMLDSNTVGAEAYRVECLRPVAEKHSAEHLTTVPFYERYGELRVTEGFYGEVIRYRQHILPFSEALWQHAANS